MLNLTSFKYTVAKGINNGRTFNYASLARFEKQCIAEIVAGRMEKVEVDLAAPSVN